MEPEITGLRNSDPQRWQIEEKGAVVVFSRVHGASEKYRSFVEDDDQDNRGDDDDDDDDKDDEDGSEDGYEDLGEDDDEADSIECKISFSKHKKGVMLVTALATEEAFSVKSVSYSRDTSIATEHPGGEAWERRALYSRKTKDLGDSVCQSVDNYLNSRGLDEGLAKMIYQYAKEKEEKECSELIKSITSFMLS